MKGATAIASILKAEGVDFVGCIPSHPLLDALALEDIRLIIPARSGWASTWWTDSAA